MTIKAIELKNRTVLKLSGGDTRSFIQGLITNDIDALEAKQGLYAALLTPQGKFLFDMIIIPFVIVSPILQGRSSVS